MIPWDYTPFCKVFSPATDGNNTRHQVYFHPIVIGVVIPYLKIILHRQDDVSKVCPVFLLGHRLTQNLNTFKPDTIQMKNKFIFSLCLLLNFSLLHAAVYYVSPTGSDNNPGNIKQPFATLQKAQSVVKPGDTVYIRGGTYRMKEEHIAARERIFAYVTNLNKSGEKGKLIKYWSYPGERPVFDYAEVKPEDLRVIAFYVTGSWIHIKGLEIIGVQVTIKGHTQSECFENKGSNNIYEQLSMHDGMAIGFYLLNGSDNLILNCDAYRNYDYFSETGRGGNTDGFGAHGPKGATGNVFRGCRAWFNSDDGYDVINSAEPVLFENCWGFYNGFSPDFKNLGDGNGFKMGGYGNRRPEDLPVPIPQNKIRNCIAVRNKANGFYSNHHINGSIWTHNIAYKNPVNYNMLNRLKNNVTDVAGYNHTLYYNIGYKGTREIHNFDSAYNTFSNNFLDTDKVLTDEDFQSVDTSLLTAPRNKNGNLPDNGFLKPVSKRLKDIHFAIKELPVRFSQPGGTEKITRDSLHGMKYEIKKLVFSDDFETLDKRWIAEIEMAPGSSVYAKNNELIMDTKKGVTVWLDTLLKGDIALEFDRTVWVDNGPNDRLSDMNMFWMATDAQGKKPFGRNGVFESYDSLTLYYAGIGGNTNKTTRFRMYKGGNKPLLQERNNPGQLLVKNKTYHITITVKNNTTALWIDDECYFHFVFEQPLTAGYFGLRSTWSRQSVKNFRIYKLM